METLSEEEDKGFGCTIDGHTESGASPTTELMLIIACSDNQTVVLTFQICLTLRRCLVNFGEEFVDAAGYKGEEQPSRFRFEVYLSMYAVTGHNNRSSGSNLELFACTVKVKSAFKDFKELLPIFVIVEWRSYERWNALR